MWVCTECETVYASETKAVRCHWGIGGVVTVAEYIEMYGPLDSHNQVC